MQIGLGLGLTRLQGVGYDTSVVPEAFTSILTAGTSDAAMLWLGTSIGNDWISEHVGLLDTAWATAFPNYGVRHNLYVATVPSAGAYTPKKLVGYSAGSSLFADTFNRADGSLGTTSSGGQSYAANTWTISGNRAVQASSGNFLTTASGLGNDKHIIEADFRQGSGGGDARIYALYTSTSNAVFLSCVAATGVCALVYASGAVQLSSTATGGAFGSGEDIHLKLTVDGSWLYAEITRSGTTYATAGKLTSAQKTATTGSKVMISGINTITGQSWDNYSIVNIAETRRLDVINASVPSADLAYHVANLGTTFTQTVDLVVIEASHNEGTADVPTFWASLDDAVAAVRGVQANVPIAVMMENPEVSPATNRAAHNARVESLPAYARSRRVGLIDGYTGYDTANIISDGIHPSTTGSAYLESRDAAAFGIAA